MKYLMLVKLTSYIITVIVPVDPSFKFKYVVSGCDLTPLIDLSAELMVASLIAGIFDMLPSNFNVINDSNSAPSKNSVIRMFFSFLLS